MLYPQETKVRSNVIDSSAQAAPHPRAARDPGSAPQPGKGVAVDGNPVGLPIRMVNNAPTFNQIVAAAAIINGAIDQKESSAFIELTTSKRIASLNVELSKLEAEISKARVDKAENDRKLGVESGGTDENGEAMVDDFVLPNEAPAEGHSQAAPSLLTDSPNPEPAPSPRSNTSSASEDSGAAETVKFTSTLKLKGLTGDGRVALQLGDDFASNVIVGQVVWGRYRIEEIDQGTSCIAFTDLRVKKSRGRACYN
jgi:hypothetical protein